MGDSDSNTYTRTCGTVCRERSFGTPGEVVVRLSEVGRLTAGAIEGPTDGSDSGTSSLLRFKSRI